MSSLAHATRREAPHPPTNTCASEICDVAGYGLSRVFLGLGSKRFLEYSLWIDVGGEGCGEDLCIAKFSRAKLAIRLPNNNSWSRARAADGSPAEFLRKRFSCTTATAPIKHLYMSRELASVTDECVARSRDPPGP